MDNNFFNSLKQKLKINEANEGLSSPYMQKKAPTSALESGLRGAAQGVSMGFADELAGALGGAKDYITGDEANITDAYRKNRDVSRQAYEQAASDNPKMYGAGDIVGSIGTLAIPGMNAFNGVKGLAALGAASGLGRSDANTPQGLVKDSVVGATIGGVTGALFPKILSRFGKNGKIAPLTEEEVFRKELNPDVFDLQTTGKASPALKAKASQIDADLAKYDAQELKKIKEDAQNWGFDNLNDYYEFKKNFLSKQSLSNETPKQISSEQVTDPTLKLAI